MGKIERPREHLDDGVQRRVLAQESLKGKYTGSSVPAAVTSEPAPRGQRIVEFSSRPRQTVSFVVRLGYDGKPGLPAFFEKPLLQLTP
jgi:hypothetical protein